MSTKFFVYISGKWCEINTENGQVSGFREKATFVYLSKGKLNVAKRRSVLRGLKALASGDRTTVREGPQLPYKKMHPPEAKRKSENYNLHKYHHHCCCAKAQALGSSTDLNSNKILEKPIVAKESVAIQCFIDTGTQADNIEYTKAFKRPHEVLTDEDLPTPKRVANASQNNNKGIELAKALERHKFSNKKYNPNLYRELLISDEDVAVFRRFLIKNNTDVDLCKFDCDDAYKAKMFYAINPLVDVERSPMIRVQKEISEDEMTLKNFAVKLGLVSVNDVKKDNRYKTRNSLNKPKMRVPEVNSESPSTDSDFENSNPNTKNLKKQLEADKTNKRQKKPHSARSSAFKTKRQWIKDDTSSDDSDDQTTHLKIRHGLNKHNTKENLSLNGGTKEGKRQIADKPNNKIQVNVNQHSGSNKKKGSSNRDTKVNIGHSASKPTAKLHLKDKQDSDSESSDDPQANIKVNTRSNPSKKDQNNQVTLLPQDSDSSVKSKDNVKVNTRHSLSKKNQNVTVEDMSTNQNSVDKKYPTRSNVAGKDTIEKKRDIIRKDVIDRNNVNIRKGVAVDIKDLGNDIDKENFNTKISKENIRVNILKKLDKESTKPKAETQVIREKNTITVSDNDEDNNRKKNERDSKTSKLSDDKKVVQKVGPKFKIPKRSSVPAGREYTNLEDHAIVAWVSTGGRARKVNGNRLWRELQMDYQRLTGQSRSWHSLRNRYLRYLLPALHALKLPPTLSARLRAAAATGEIKSRKKKSSGASAPLRSAPSAWSLRPRTPRPAPPADEHTLVDDIHLSPTRDRRSASTSPARSQEASSSSKIPSTQRPTNPTRSKRSSRPRRRSSSTSPPRSKNSSPPRSKNSRRRSSSSSPPRLKNISPPRSKKSSRRRSSTRQRSSSRSPPHSRRPSPPWRGISPPQSSRSASRSLRAAPHQVQKTRKLFNPNAPSIMN